MKYNKILYVGVIDDGSKNIVGGFASANKRNISEYLRRGFDVSFIPYPILDNRNLLGYLSYLLDWIKFFFRLLTIKLFSNNGKKTIVHFTPLYKYFIYIEYFIIKILKINNGQVLLDIRAGSFIDYVENSSSVYYLILKNVIQKSNLITVEGEKYIDYIKQKFNYNSAIYYYPNYVADSQILRSKCIDNIAVIKLLYFGRITSQKGVEIIVNIHRELIEKGINVETNIIGSFEDKNLKEELESLNIIKLKFSPPLNKKEINKIMKTSNFFIFPTKHKGEGHSNALTEAYGLIPVVSDNGFNINIVETAGIILNKEASSSQYVYKILEVLEVEEMNRLSNNSIEIIQKKFSQSRVMDVFFENLKNKWGE